MFKIASFFKNIHKSPYFLDAVEILWPIRKVGHGPLMGHGPPVENSWIRAFLEIILPFSLFPHFFGAP